MTARIPVIITVILLVLGPHSRLFSQETFKKLAGLYEKKEYFRMYEHLKTSDITGWERAYFEALSFSLLSRFDESNKLINSLFAENNPELNDSLRFELSKIKLQNMVNMGNYKEASVLTDEINSQFSVMLDSTEKAEMLNSGIIWKAAADIPPQAAEFNGNTTVSAKRDMAGLINIPLLLNGEDADFVFDTGANFSVITKSYAEKHNLRLLNGKIKVGGITGNKMDSELGVADELKIGNVIFRNVLFLVMPDEMLSFAGGLYKINGIIGFPVIRGMKEIHFREDELFIPKTPAVKNDVNLMLSGFIPVINVIHGSDSLTFSFDTGAKKTILFFPYYEKYKKQVDSRYEQEEIEVGGAGENKKVKGFILDEVTLRIAGVKAVLKDVRLVKEKLISDSKYFYGNLGQDFFSRYGEMILNFESMYVELKN